MNVFVAGIHGVGKTYVASRATLPPGMRSVSASKLIKDEKQSANWGVDKRVADVDANQIALTSAVNRLNGAGAKLLLDGHFVLLGQSGEFIRLGAEVFESMHLSGVILVEADAQTVVDRLAGRDDRESTVKRNEEFLLAERIHAQDTCRALGIPLVVLASPTPEAFGAAVQALAG